MGLWTFFCCGLAPASKLILFYPCELHTSYHILAGTPEADGWSTRKLQTNNQRSCRSEFCVCATSPPIFFFDRLLKKVPILSKLHLHTITVSRFDIIHFLEGLGVLIIPLAGITGIAAANLVHDSFQCSWQRNRLKRYLTGSPKSLP